MAEPRYWGLVPAAGVGARMGADRPKQYLDLLGRSVIAHTLVRLCSHPRLSGVLVCIAPGDTLWRRHRPEVAGLLGEVAGGAERADSVLNGLEKLSERAKDDDYVLIHDAVRPCLRHADVDALIAGAGGPAGGLLAVPLSDTLKRVDASGRVAETVPRAGLWRAMTPQMFPLGSLRRALRSARDAGVEVTDEASAMERMGLHPRVVRGHPDNIKITVAEDLALAAHCLRGQLEAGA